MSKDNLKQLLGLIMMVLGLFVLFTTFGSKYSGARPLVPALVPFFGLYFGIGLTILQLIYCWVFDAKTGYIWMAAAWIVAVPLIYISQSARDILGPYPNAMPEMARLITGPACVCAIAIGFGTLKRKI
jgi:predicted permease